MKKRILPLIFLISGLGFVIFFSQMDKRRQESIVESATAFPVMSTIATFRLYGSQNDADKAIRCGKKVFEHTVRTCSYFDPESELARMNAAAAETPFHCSADLWNILLKVREIHRLSDGAFDPTIRPLMKLWGFHCRQNRLPSEKMIDEAKKICGFSKIVFDDSAHTVFFPVKGMSVDLGGIAKGWAVDQAVQKIRKETAIRSGILDLGGNLFCLPVMPYGKPVYRIGIKDPRKPEKICCTAIIRNAAAATSGGYERFSVINGKRYGHIMDPQTAHPADTDILSATVIAPTALEADALSTVLYLRGEKFFDTLRMKKPFVRALVIKRGKNGSLKFCKLGSGWITP